MVAQHSPVAGVAAHPVELRDEAVLGDVAVGLASPLNRAAAHSAERPAA
jgi:hypothetical protein